jgi:hypothetical protein
MARDAILKATFSRTRDMTASKLRNACVRVSAFSAVATIVLGGIYVIGKTDALMILPLISATVALVAAIPAACEVLFTRRGLGRAGLGRRRGGVENPDVSRFSE